VLEITDDDLAVVSDEGDCSSVKSALATGLTDSSDCDITKQTSKKWPLIYRLPEFLLGSTMK